jgi:RNA polymerase sigma factor (sigma-70 family)
MEASVLRESASPSASLLQDPRARFLRLQSDERLVSLTRRGNDAAFETLIDRYRTRLLAFSRHMVGSTEDAEDILQEVFVSAYRAMLADDRELNVRPWLYRIARNRSLNHLRRPRPTGVDSMDVYEGGAATATADRVHDKLDLEDLVDDVKRLPETQRTALMLREMGDLSYDQIAETMDTSIPSVKSLLVRARVSLAEAAESRRLSCDEVRMELGAVAEGLQKISSPARRHVADCERCRSFKKELSTTNRKLTMLAPVGAFAALKAIVALKLFSGATAAGSSAAGGTAAAGTGVAAGGATAAGTAAAGSAAAGTAAAGAGSSAAVAGLGAVAAKVGTGLVAAAIVTGGVAQVARHDISTAKIDQKATIAKVAPAQLDPAKSGGATAGVAAAAVATPEEHKADPTGATGATENVTTAPAPKTDAQLKAPVVKPVVEKDSTTVSLGGGHEGASAPSGSSTESPGLPTGSQTTQPTAAPSPPPAAASPPSPQTGLSEPTDGASADTGGSGGPTE